MTRNVRAALPVGSHSSEGLSISATMTTPRHQADSVEAYASAQSCARCSRRIELYERQATLIPHASSTAPPRTVGTQGWRPDPAWTSTCGVPKGESGSSPNKPPARDSGRSEAAGIVVRRGRGCCSSLPAPNACEQRRTPPRRLPLRRLIALLRVGRVPTRLSPDRALGDGRTWPRSWPKWTFRSQSCRGWRNALLLRPNGSRARVRGFLHSK